MTAKHANSEVRRAVRDTLFGNLNGLRIPTRRRRTVGDRVYLDVTTALGDRPSSAQAEAMRRVGLQPYDYHEALAHIGVPKQDGASLHR